MKRHAAFWEFVFVLLWGLFLVWMGYEIGMYFHYWTR